MLSADDTSRQRDKDAVLVSQLEDLVSFRWVKFDPLGHILYTGISNNTTAQRDEAARVSMMK